jgi:hypothetical protein
MKKITLIILCCFLSVIGFSQSGTKARSAKSGQYVTKDYAKKNPSTTVVERDKTAKSTSSGTTRRKK